MLIETSLNRKEKTVLQAKPFLSFAGMITLAAIFTGSAFALGGPPTPVPGDSRPDPVWVYGSGIGTDLNENGTPKAGQTGQITAPQNQTVNPATPAIVEVATGQVITLNIQPATDYDHWYIPWQAGTGPVTKQYGVDYGDAADTVSYSWTGPGAFSSPLSSTTSWTAPATIGDCTLTCTIDDSNANGRNDAAISRSVVIHVLPPKKWTVGTAVSTNIVNGIQSPDGRMTTPQNQTGTPTPAKIVVAPGSTLSPNVEVAHDWDHWERDLNANGVIEAGEEGDEENTVTYKWTATGGNLSNHTQATASWVAPTQPGRYTLTCEIDDSSATVDAPNTGTRDDVKVSRTVDVDVWSASLQVKRKDEPNYSSTTSIAGGGLGTPVHQADIELTVTDADGSGVSGVTVNPATLDGGGFDHLGGVTTDVIAFPPTGLNGKAIVSLNSRQLVDDNITIKVPYDAANVLSDGAETTISQVWGSGEWIDLPEYIDYDTETSIIYQFTMSDGVEIGGHGITFMVLDFSAVLQRVFRYV